MNSLDYVVDKVLEVIRRDIRKNTSDSSDVGTVKRIDGNIAWVQYDEKNPQVTPVVISGASCKKGDKVRIKNNNGTAFILGNDSNPPTDDTKAEHAQVTAEISGRTAEEAQTTASEAEQTATVASQTAEAADTKADTALEQVGASITTDTLHYLATDLDSGVTTSTPGWTTTIQSITEEDPYLWTYHTYHKASGQSVNTTPVITGVYGPQGEQGIQGIQGPAGNDGNDGDDGVSVTAVQPQYYLSTSSSSATGGSWGNSLNYETGKYIWTRDQITYSNSTTGYSTAIYNEALTTACSTSEQALNVAEGIDEHFWYDNTGAHITKDTQEDYQADPKNAGGNTLITSQGMAIRKGTTELATFGAGGIQIGQDEEAHSTVEKDKMEIYLDGDEQPYFHVGMLKDPTALYYQSSNKVLGADIRKNTGTRIAPCFIGQWGVAWAYTASFPICPIDVSLDISYTGTAPTTNVYWLDWYVEQNKEEALYGTADVIADGEKLGWSTRAKCESAVTSFLASYEYPNDYLRTVQFGAGYGQMTDTIDDTDYTYWTYNYETNHNFNPNYDVQACILYLKQTVTKYELWVGGHAVTGSDAFIISTRCKSITTNYKLYTEEIIASFFAGDGIVPTNRDQFVIGSYNETSTDDVAFVVGNGTDDSHRSNCFTVARDGTIRAGNIIGENIHSTTGDITDSKGNKLSNKADASDVPTKTSQLTNDSGFISEDKNGDIAITRNITAGGELTASNIGAKNWVAPSSVSCQTGKWYKVAEVTLDPGIWFIDCNAHFPKTNATGARQIRVTTATFTNGTTTAPASYGNITNDIIAGANTAQYPQAHFPVDISSRTTFRLAAYQGSGSTMSVTGRMYATRIK